MSGDTIYWLGTEDEQHIERMKACRERRDYWDWEPNPDRRWWQFWKPRRVRSEPDCDLDGQCSECAYDMWVALRVTEAEWLAAGGPSDDD